MKSNSIQIDHGSGGVLSSQLVNQIATWLGSGYIGSMEDSELIDLPGNRIAMSTDSFIVSPLFFNGGDIGKISVCGTVNDLAMSGAIPRYLSLSLIIEEGFSMDVFEQVIRSIASTSELADVKVVCGDTKVMPRGSLDKLIINTAGIGYFMCNSPLLSSQKIEEGDFIILSGHIGDHGIQILSMREGLGYENVVPSDCAPLNLMMQSLLINFPDSIHCGRDLTRGGLATCLNELSVAAGFSFHLDSSKIPVRLPTRMACDMLDIDPYHLANEGCMALFVKPIQANQIVESMREFLPGRDARIIGSVHVGNGSVAVREFQEDGSYRVLLPLAGRVLPRLC